jgi:prevent-host-death family protein
MIKMLETELGLTKAREQLSTIVESVQYQGDAYIISRHGTPAAALVPIQVYEKWKQQRQEFFNLIREFQESSGENDPEEIMREVLEAQQAVRAELRNAD